ncbi:hypothetical protein POL68_41615 [Stigmatella sp. ncwal1]|uniref:Uncharacterized protein n=1 Tax=Stigmatella ashevillensis TaxID=2995309 RepID=A0ABT5DRK1_9BACT|nr:hypothetical protein [Stigmatella ashevillena]MDC0715021.1 hypothetical protein [Stigmatella ashevillena]
MPTFVAALSSPSAARGDPLREAVESLSQALPARADAAVLVELLEDDLREGLDALGDVEAHFSEVIDALSADTPSAFALISVGDEQRVLQRLDTLMGVVTQVRRRLSKAAGLLRASPGTSPARFGR